MTEKLRVKAASTSTHSGDKVVEKPGSEFQLKNSQAGAQMLIDPEDTSSGNTHSADDLKIKGPKKVPTTAAVTDQELTGPTDLHDIDPEVNPGEGYQDDAENTLPVVEVPAAVEEVVEDVAEDNPFAEEEGVDEEFTEDLDEVSSEFDDEFADLPAMELESDADELTEDIAEEPVAEEFEVPMDETETVALVDADEVEDTIGDEDDFQFATIANVVHVIRANRIIASMGAVTAKRAGAADVYTTPQFQDVVVANIEAKGLRKGLVQSGFVLSRVKLSASSKATSKAVTAKVEASVAKRVAILAAQEKAMEQSLAIAAVGINRRFFKDTTNELKANLETELAQLGVRGGQTLVRAMFAKYGVSYAKSILTLAKKISAMPQEMRDTYVDALDMTDSAEEEILSEECDDLDEDEYADEDGFDPIPATVSAALLHSPRRNVPSLLAAGVKTTAAMQILSGSQSLV